MTTTMILSDPEWTNDERVASWAEDPNLANIAQDCADTEYAWLVNHTHEALRGWSFREDGTFSGPPVDGAYQVVLGLIVQAADFVLANLDEIAAELDAIVGEAQP